jgi:geranylgeranyl pyrophosphate synthase
MSSRLRDFQSSKLPLIEGELRACLPLSPLEGAQRLNQALEYTVNSGGKRVRPLLTLMVAEIFPLPPGVAPRLACAVEFLHLSSVIFDDLPSMDDARTRRHAPALHVAFDEAVATLAALALYAKAFEILSPWPVIVERAARAIGSEGMIGGQAADLSGVRGTRLRKTAPLFALAVAAPAQAGRASPDELATLEAFGDSLGEAYQLCDDLLDVLASESLTGKTAGQDLRHGRHALGNDFTPEKAFQRLRELVGQARRLLHQGLPPCPGRDLLDEFTQWMERRAAELKHGHPVALGDGGDSGARGGERGALA